MTNSPNYPTQAVLQIRSSASCEAHAQISCTVDSLVNRRLTLISNERVSVSSAVTVEYNDSMLLGEVVACTQDCDQKWHLELKIEQILTGLQSLMTLRERLLGESAPAQMRPMAATAYQR